MKVKRQPTEWKKRFVNYISDRVNYLVYIQFPQLKNKKTTQLKHGQRN